ncbi:hypothetical protein Q2T40_09185 [Winogradskyella maritima]|uniref:Uncharacterized protein n=1 Tax=Winogradskyella maritima TaxID=1517766 RepID=A0ABV8AIC5_9FLAO|nr:hypothetical protein [Winogradskyella maritima]
MKESFKEVDKGPLKSEHISQYGERDYDDMEQKRKSNDLTKSGLQDFAQKESAEKAKAFKEAKNN